MAPRYGMVIDIRKCVGCGACAVACKQENNVPVGKYRTWVKTVEKGKYPNTKTYYMPSLCNHCEDPICVRNCPVGASYQREDGIVLVDYDRCVGCRYCIASCPYDVRFINPVKKVAEKCTFCIHRVERGVDPACVATCMTKARVFGDLNDPNSKVSKLIASNPVQVIMREKGTYPQVYYIGGDLFAMRGQSEDLQYVKYYYRDMKKELGVTEEYIEKMHSILEGRCNADLTYDHRKKNNEPLRR